MRYKQITISLLLVLVVLLAGTIVYKNHQKSFFEQNLEALTDGEATDTIDCHPRPRVNGDYTWGAICPEGTADHHYLPCEIYNVCEREVTGECKIN